MVAGVRRLAMVGEGYTALADGSSAFRLLTGAPHTEPGSSFRTGADCSDEPGRELRYFAALLDMPVQNLPRTYLVGIFALAIAVIWSLRAWIPTIDGKWFSRFMGLATLSILLATALLAAQAAATWAALRPKLVTLSQTPIAAALERIGQVLRWDLSIARPNLNELTILAARTDTLKNGMITIGKLRGGLDALRNVTDRRTLDTVDALKSLRTSSLSVRGDDLSGLTKSLTEPDHLQQLKKEIAEQRNAPLLQSPAWFGLWRISDSLVSLLEKTHWRRSQEKRRRPGSDSAPGVLRSAPEESASGGVGPYLDGASRRQDVVTLSLNTGDHATEVIEQWFSDCEEFVALQYAFVLRDVLARIMSPLFAAMVALSCLSGAHLFYLFPGRSSTLAIDLFAMIGMAVVAIPIVVGIERDPVLSRLRMTTPGRIDLNSDFLKRVALYGVLPLLVVIGSVFPEIGSSLFEWLEPLRQLAAF